MINLDLLFAIVALLFFLIGIRRGLVLSLISLGGTIISVFLIIKIGPLLKLGLMNSFSLSPIISTIIAYILIFVTIGVLAKIILIILSKIVKLLKLNWLDRILGGFFNLITLTALTFLIFYFFRVIFPEHQFQYLEESFVYRVFNSLLSNIQSDYLWV